MSDTLVKRLLTQAGVAVLAGVLSSSAVWAEDDASVSGESEVAATDPSAGDTGVASEPAETQDGVSDAGDEPQVTEEPDVTIDPVEEPEIAICPVEGEVPEPIDETGTEDNTDEAVDVGEEPEIVVDPGYMPGDEVYVVTGTTGGEDPAPDQTPVLADDSGMLPDVQPMAQGGAAEPVFAHDDGAQSDPALICQPVDGPSAICAATLR